MTNFIQVAFRKLTFRMCCLYKSFITYSFPANCVKYFRLLQLLQDSGGFLDHLGNWELVAWCMGLGIYLLRFMTLGTKINKKYRNFSVLITEQVGMRGEVGILFTSTFRSTYSYKIYINFVNSYL